MQMQVVLETDSIAGVASRRLAWAGDFDNVAPFETIIARHWISQLDTRKLRLLQPASKRGERTATVTPEHGVRYALCL